jgi:drug/metabolite transporter (DMT)-like permease
MDPSLYWFGVICAITSGVVSNLGLVLEKKVVNEIPPEAKFGRSLIKSPLWLLGIFLGQVVGAVFFLVAELFIGATLSPVLIDAGLIVLALGSVKILGESLKKDEYIGLFILIAGIILVGFSGLSITISEIDLFELGFLIRMLAYTLGLIIAALICEILQRKANKYRGIYFAFHAAFMFSLSNFWVNLLMGIINHIFSGIFSAEELVLFICAAILIVLSNFVAIYTVQRMFKYGDASKMVPIHQIPLQITPVIVYFLIFMLIPPTVFSFYFLIGGAILITIATFIFANRQAKLESIK